MELSTEQRRKHLDDGTGIWTETDEMLHQAQQDLEDEAAYGAEMWALDARLEAEWDLPTTIQRRTEWNARIKAGELNARPGKPTGALLRDAEKAQGWTVNDLKIAVQRHGL